VKVRGNKAKIERELTPPPRTPAVSMSSFKDIVDVPSNYRRNKRDIQVVTWIQKRID